MVETTKSGAAASTGPIKTRRLVVAPTLGLLAEVRAALMHDIRAKLESRGTAGLELSQ